MTRRCLTVSDGVWIGDVLAVGGSSAAAGVGPRAAVWFTSDGARIVMIGSGLDRSSVYTSTDGLNFIATDLSADIFKDTTFAKIEPVAGGFVAVGSEFGPGRDRNGAIWFSADGVTWSEVLVDGLDGLGSQRAATAATAPDGALTIAGFDNGAPVIWNVPAAALP